MTYLWLFLTVFGAFICAGYLLLRLAANGLGEMTRLLCEHINECRKAIIRIQK